MYGSFFGQNTSKSGGHSMLHAPTLEFVTENLQRLNFKEAKLVGILFMQPDSKIAKEDIIPRFGYYNQRAGAATDFFFAGYGAYWPPSKYPDQRRVIDLDGIKWLYSDRAFNSFRSELQSRTAWKYSGQTDLILTSAKFIPDRSTVGLDFSQCITCCLEALVCDGAIESVPALFEKIFHFGETRAQATAYDFSDLHFLRTTGNWVLEWFLSRFGLKEYFNKNKGMAIREISRAA